MDLVDKVARAWIDGDTDTIARLSEEGIKREAPKVYQKVIIQRNIVWSEKIAVMLKGSGVQQIAVGAAHLGDLALRSGARRNPRHIRRTWRATHLRHHRILRGSPDDYP